ncbi:MAG: hypothetical protein AAGD47_10735 [Pseudomonadota bacterium]
MIKRGAHPLDSRGIIAESYKIDGITVEDCRSIFFDWALGLDASANAAESAATLLAAYTPPEDHPMTALLNEAVQAKAAPRRRRGRRSN